MDFLTREGTRLAASAAATNFTATNATNQITVTSHGLVTGDGPFTLTNSGGALPTGLALSTLYWVSVVDANTLQLHTSKRENVGIAATEFSDDGTGTHTMTRETDAEAMFHVNRANVPTVIANATDIDAI